MRPNEKPMWLLRIQYDVSVDFDKKEYSENDLSELKRYIDNKILDLIKTGVIRRSNISTDLIKDEQKTVLWIIRNDIPLQQYYIK